MASLNRQIFEQLVAQQADRVITPAIAPIMEKKFKDEKKVLMEQFDSHPVTLELEAGPDYEGSGLVSTAHGGNLFSFLGFNRGEKPVIWLRETLEKFVTKGRLTKEKISDGFLYSYEIRVPSKREIYSRTRILEWTTRSFVDLVENGIPGFGRYIFDLFKIKHSRSKTGVEAKKPLRQPASSAKIPYVTLLLNSFRERFER